MSEVKLEETRGQESKLEVAIQRISDMPDGLGIYFLRHLCDELGFLRPNIHQNNDSKEVLTSVMIGNEANIAVWIKLRDMMSDDTLFKVEIQSRRDKVKLKQKAPGVIEQWQTEQQQHQIQAKLWDNRILEES
jgi:hypothetical protein